MSSSSSKVRVVHRVGTVADEAQEAQFRAVHARLKQGLIHYLLKDNPNMVVEDYHLADTRNGYLRFSATGLQKLDSRLLKRALGAVDHQQLSSLSGKTITLVVSVPYCAAVAKSEFGGGSLLRVSIFSLLLFFLVSYLWRLSEPYPWIQPVRSLLENWSLFLRSNV